MERNFTYIYDGMNAFEKEVKRLLDFLLATVCLIIFSPLFLACYIAVKRNHDGPVIFKQERIGRFGRPFYIYKFRSMRIDAENDGPHLCSDNRDKRLTKTGRFLRAHRRRRDVFSEHTISTNCPNCGISSLATWLLSDLAQKESIISR